MATSRSDRDWDRIDRVLRYMIPQGFGSLEVSQTVGVPRAQTIGRANLLGLPFSRQFGPESKCRAGHRFSDVGYTTVTSPLSGRVTKRCKVCYAEHKRKTVANRRAKRAEERAKAPPKERAKKPVKTPPVKVPPKKRAPKPKRRRPVLVKFDENSSTKRSYEAAMATNSIIALHEQKERAPTWWQREAIQEQINELQKRVTA